jgi:hypothetical protein
LAHGGFWKSKKSFMSLVLPQPSRAFNGGRLKRSSTNFQPGGVIGGYVRDVPRLAEWREITTNVRITVEALLGKHNRVHLIPPVDYFEFLSLLRRCYFVLTDSGGVQEEAQGEAKAFRQSDLAAPRKLRRLRRDLIEVPGNECCSSPGKPDIPRWWLRLERYRENVLDRTIRRYRRCRCHVRCHPL